MALLLISPVPSIRLLCHSLLVCLLRQVLPWSRSFPRSSHSSQRSSTDQTLLRHFLRTRVSMQHPLYCSCPYYLIHDVNKTPINPNHAGLLGNLKWGGGADFSPSQAPRITAAERQKICEIWHIWRVSQYEYAEEISKLKIKAFFKLCKYMWIICICSYFNHNWSNKTFWRHNSLLFLMDFIVLWISYVFLCFCDLWNCLSIEYQ